MWDGERLTSGYVVIVWICTSTDWDMFVGYKLGGREGAGIGRVYTRVAWTGVMDLDKVGRRTDLAGIWTLCLG